MNDKQVSTKGSEAMSNIAEHYSAELNAQFRTLNHFVGNAGEIGRAHETFLRGILSRFLPNDIRLTSGFVGHPKWTSRQQDILIHKRDIPTLFEVGDCTVINHEAFIGTVEVKTQLQATDKIREAVEKQADFRESMGHHGLYAIYAWDGATLDTTIATLWDFVRSAPTKRFGSMPDLLLFRNKFLLMANCDGKRDSQPFKVWHINNRGISEGQALLGLIAAVWRFGFSTVFPWWLLSWHDHLGTVHGKFEYIEWPSDLQISVMADLAK